MIYLTKEQRKARDIDFRNREKPRTIWHSTEDGTAIRAIDAQGRVRYTHKPVVRKGSNARKLTEAEDNALARAKRRRFNKHSRGWRPYAQR